MSARKETAGKFYKPYLMPIKGFLHKVNRTYEKRAIAGLKSFCHRDPASLRAVVAVSKGEEAEDGAILDRLIAAYREDGGDPSKPSAIWRDIYDRQQAPLHAVLMGEDKAAIARLLRRPGDSALFYGFEGGVSSGYAAMLKKGGRNAYLDALSLAPHDHLIRLAEITGALAFENPERKPKAYGGLPTDEVLAAIEARLGLELTFPNPYPDEAGTRTRRGIMTYRAVHAIYQAWRIRTLTARVKNPRIVEIGGGLGRTAYYAWQMGIRDYTIVDLPFTAVSQGYFLMRTVGENNVLLHGESDGASSDKIKILQPGAFLEGGNRYDLAVNVDSLPEMGRDVAEGYWRRIGETAPLFLSINQEANAFAVREIADAHVDALKSWLRYPSSLRKGYMEEIFTF